METPRSMNTNLLRTQWAHLSEDAIRRMQAAKLRDYLRRVVLPFSSHYREMFQEQGLTPDSIRSLEDLQRLPFTSKLDLLNTPGSPAARTGVCRGSRSCSPPASTLDSRSGTPGRLSQSEGWI